MLTTYTYDKANRLPSQQRNRVRSADKGEQMGKLHFFLLWAAVPLIFLSCKPSSTPEGSRQSEPLTGSKAAVDHPQEGTFEHDGIVGSCESRIPAGLGSLAEAARAGESNVVNELLSRGTDVNGVPAPEKNGYTPLYWALSTHHPAIAQRLIDAGADLRELDLKERKGWSALHEAASRKEVNLLIIMLDRGAKVDWEWNEGFTPLMADASSGDVEAVTVLISRGAKKRNGDAANTVRHMTCTH